MSESREPYRIKIVGRQTKQSWQDLANLMAECRDKGWPIKVVLDGEEAHRSLRESGVSLRERSPAPPTIPTDQQQKKAGIWARLFGA